MPCRFASSAACFALLVVACSPALDWREFVPEGAGIGVSFPCRPDRHSRVVMIAGTRMQMEMLTCNAGGASFGLVFADAAEPANIGASLAALRTAAADNLHGVSAPGAELRVRGMTPNEQATSVIIDGRLPDGRAVREHASFFTRGLRIFQATVIGAEPAPQVVETFITSLKFPE